MTYDHRLKETGHPVRSGVLKFAIDCSVVGWVTTSEYQLLYVFGVYCSIFGMVREGEEKHETGSGGGAGEWCTERTLECAVEHRPEIPENQGKSKTKEIDRNYVHISADPIIYNRVLIHATILTLFQSLPRSHG